MDSNTNVRVIRSVPLLVSYNSDYLGIALVIAEVENSKLATLS